MKYILKSTLVFVFGVVFFLPNISLAASFGVLPAYPRADNPRTDSIFVHTVEPNGIISDGVIVVNSTNETKNLLLYARDSAKSSGGGFACAQLSEKPTGVGAWVSFDLSKIDKNNKSIVFGAEPGTVELQVPSGAEIVIPFTISAPGDVSVGEQNGCILVQEIKEKSKEAGMSLSLRSGIRIAMTIPGEVVRKLEFADFNIEKKDGSIYFMPSVTNTGNVSIDTDTKVEVRYFFGLLHETFGGEFPVLRGDTYDFNFELKRPFFGGLYRAKAIFAYDSSKTTGIGTESDGQVTTFESSTKWFFSFPTILGLITEIVAIILIFFGVNIYRLYKKKKKWIKHWVNYKVKSDDTIQKLSKKLKINWKILAEVNNLKAPYTIEPNITIKIPPTKKKK